MCKCEHCGCLFSPSRHSSGKFCGQGCYHAHPKVKVPFATRFWAFIQKGDGCWLWTGSDDGEDGYGRIKYGPRNIGAHRASWLIHFGEIGAGLYVCHRCDNPRCVRPDHLFLGTNLDNMRDCAAKGRRPPFDNRGSRHGMSKLTEEKVMAIRAAYIPMKRGNRAELSAKFGVSVSAINQIIWRARWTHV